MKLRGYLLFVGLLVLGLIWAEATRPRPLDVSVRLERQGDAPFDAEVFFEALPDWLGQPVEVVTQPPFSFLADSARTGTTYLFLAQSFAPDRAEADRLLRFAAAGNTVFVAAHNVAGPLAEALGDTTGADGFRTTFTGYGLGTPGAALQGDSLVLAASGAVYGFPVRVDNARIFDLDPARTELVGTSHDPGRRSHPTLVRVRHGQGEVIVCSTPLAFSNAALTGDGDAALYVGAVLDALPRQPVLWDAYRSAGVGQGEGPSPLRFVLSTPALRWAYLLLVLSGLLYLAFRARRWQRAIPVVTPPPNAQREFARTVGRLHYVHRDESRLARRQARHVLDRVRTELGISDPDLTPETARRVAPRAGVPEDEALALWATLARVSRETRPDPDTLVRLDGRIARFFRHTGAPAPTD